MKHDLFQLMTKKDKNINSCEILDVLDDLLVLESCLGIDILEKRTPPRIMKTHLPVQFWKKQLDEGKPKVIVMMRNAKDNIVSFFHFMNQVHDISVSDLPRTCN